MPLVGALHLLGADLPQRTGRLDDALASVPTADGQDGGADARPGGNPGRRPVEAGLAAAYMLSRQLDEGVAHAEAARALATDAADDATLRNAEVTLAVCLAFRGEVEASVALLERQIAAARTAGAEAEASRGYRMLGSVASVIVEYERGERWLRDGIDLAERVERWNDRHYLAAHLAHVLWATGRWDDAEAVADREARRPGGITTRITADHVLGYVALGRGELDRAERSLEEARVAGARMGELQRLSPALWGLAEIALQRGDPQAAIRWVEAGRLASLEVRDAAYLFPFAVTGTRRISRHPIRRAPPPSSTRSRTGSATARSRARCRPSTTPAAFSRCTRVQRSRRDVGSARRSKAGRAPACLGRRIGPRRPRPRLPAREPPSGCGTARRRGGGAGGRARERAPARRRRLPPWAAWLAR